MTREQVLCVPRTTLVSAGGWQGLRTAGLIRILRMIRAASCYSPRDRVEDDPSQLQIIPYCVASHSDDGTLLAMRRRHASTEQRLHGQLSLGVGGHINPGDGATGDPIAGGVIREWGEEVVCPVGATAHLVGALLDESTPVSRVHLGLVFMVSVAGGRATVRETDKLEGEHLTLDQLGGRRAELESWAALVYDGIAGGSLPPTAAGPAELGVPLPAAALPAAAP